MRLFETNENEAIDSPTPRNNEAKITHCKMYNPMMELTNRESSRKGMYLPYASSNRPSCARVEPPINRRGGLRVRWPECEAEVSCCSPEPLVAVVFGK